MSRFVWWRNLEWPQRISLIFDLVIVLATSTYAIIASCQLSSMKGTLTQTKTLADQSIRQANAAVIAANAASTQAATSQKELELSERPWVLATHDIERPLTFLENGSVVLVLRETLQNSGGSTAINVGWWADLVPLGPDETWKPALASQSKYCDQHRRWEDELKSNATGFILFPKQEHETTVAMGLLPDDLAKAVSASNDSQKRIGFAIVGCVWYRALFESKDVPAHQTRFTYLLGMPVGAPEGTFAALQSGTAIGTQPMVEPKGTPAGLRLFPQPMGDSAD